MANRPVGNARRRRTLGKGILGFLLLLGTFGASSGARDPGEPSSPEKKHPKLQLTATPAFGFAPLHVQLVAMASGLDSDDPNFCHAGITWIRMDPGAVPETGSKLTEDPECVHGKETISVATTYSKSFEMSEPGSFLYRIILAGKDGTQIKSNYVKVRVLRVP